MDSPIDVRKGSDVPTDGAELYELVARLFPICRSITGSGVRESLSLLQQLIPISIHEVPSGTKVFDWEVPNEWNIRDGYIKDLKGERVVDFRKSNLHVLNYSVPVRRNIPTTELRSHLFTLPESPDWIPYRTSYYRADWGFCLSQRQLDSLRDEEYEVCIDSTLGPGSLTYGEFRIQGTSDAEVLFSAHSCHPSLCNDNLSGMVIAAMLARHLSRRQLRYSYRFLWLPGTIGSITWLALHEHVLAKIAHGVVLSCLGDPGRFTYKRSRRRNAEIDRVVEHVMNQCDAGFSARDFTPSGYDERQYGSPGINLPVGCFMRTPNGDYPQYHTSADDLRFVTAEALAESLHQLLRVVNALEENRRFINLSPKGEPQLGRRGLYRAVGGVAGTLTEDAILWVLNLSDGSHSLLDIAERSGVPFEQLREAATLLRTNGLLSEQPVAS